MYYRVAGRVRVFAQSGRFRLLRKLQLVLVDLATKISLFKNLNRSFLLVLVLASIKVKA